MYSPSCSCTCFTFRLFAANVFWLKSVQVICWMIAKLLLKWVWNYSKFHQGHGGHICFLFVDFLSLKPLIDFAYDRSFTNLKVKADMSIRFFPTFLCGLHLLKHWTSLMEENLSMFWWGECYELRPSQYLREHVHDCHFCFYLCHMVFCVFLCFISSVSITASRCTVVQTNRTVDCLAG